MCGFMKNNANYWCRKMCGIILYLLIYVFKMFFYS